MVQKENEQGIITESPIKNLWKLFIVEKNKNIFWLGLLFWPVQLLRAAVERNLSLLQNTPIQLIYISLHIDMYKTMC